MRRWGEVRSRPCSQRSSRAGPGALLARPLTQRFPIRTLTIPAGLGVCEGPLGARAAPNSRALKRVAWSRSREARVSPARQKVKKKTQKKKSSNKTAGKARGHSARLLGWVIFTFLLAFGALWAVLTIDPSASGSASKPSSSEIGDASREALRDILREAGEEPSKP